jgi:flagellar P-ring protein precursor FlgI
VVPKQKTTVTEEEARMTVLKGGATIGEVVNALNAIGVTPRDLIAILQAMKAAGALQAELEIL